MIIVSPGSAPWDSFGAGLILILQAKSLRTEFLWAARDARDGQELDLWTNGLVKRQLIQCPCWGQIYSGRWSNTSNRTGFRLSWFSFCKKKWVCFFDNINASPRINVTSLCVCHKYTDTLSSEECCAKFLLANIHLGLTNERRLYRLIWFGSQK